MHKDIVPPHGGELKVLLMQNEALHEAIKEAEHLPAVRLSSRETSDLIMMGIGAFSPLTGFLGSEDYAQVVNQMFLKDGTLWPIPIGGEPSCR